MLIGNFVHKVRTVLDHGIFIFFSFFLDKDKFLINIYPDKNNRQYIGYLMVKYWEKGNDKKKGGKSKKKGGNQKKREEIQK